MGHFSVEISRPPGSVLSGKSTVQYRDAGPRDHARPAGRRGSSPAAAHCRQQWPGPTPAAGPSGPICGHNSLRLRRLPAGGGPLSMEGVGVIDRFLEVFIRLHRQRIRAARRRRRLPRHHAHRHRRHAGRPVLGLGRGRRHPRPAGQEDPLRRRLRLSSSATGTRSRGHRLRELRRARAHRLRRQFECGRAVAAGTHRRRSGSTPAGRFWLPSPS